MGQLRVLVTVFPSTPSDPRERRVRSMKPRFLLTAIVVATALLAGCSSSPESEAGSTSASDSLSSSDSMFLSMMIPHHGQALEMATLAETRAEDPRVKDLAARIKAAQGPEIEAMQSWLSDAGLPVPAATDGMGSHAGHMGMSGMLTDDELKRLAAQKGHEFDHLFLSGMVKHHEGAIDMAADVINNGKSQKVITLAQEIDKAQRAEIREMKALIEELSQHHK